MGHGRRVSRDDILILSGRPEVTHVGGGCVVIGNDGGGGKEMIRTLDGRSFQIRGAVLDMARLENMRWEVTGGRERVRQDDDRVERVGRMVNSSVYKLN